MKKFDLKAALNGEPVMLRNGEKAYIFKNIQDTHILDFKVDYPLIGTKRQSDFTGFNTQPPEGGCVTIPMVT